MCNLEATLLDFFLSVLFQDQIKVTMRIIHVKSAGILSEEECKRLEAIVYPDMQCAITQLKVLFPNHIVRSNNGHLRVTNKDQSINIALFKEENARNMWVETNFGLRSATDERANESSPQCAVPHTDG